MKTDEKRQEEQQSDRMAMMAETIANACNRTIEAMNEHIAKLETIRDSTMRHWPTWTETDLDELADQVVEIQQEMTRDTAIKRSPKDTANRYR